jgi:hypothetical protein
MNVAIHITVVVAAGVVVYLPVLEARGVVVKHNHFLQTPPVQEEVLVVGEAL